MNLKFQPIQISEEDPFANDLLNRKIEIENLSILLLNVNSPAVIAIDSRWGTGKTTFIHMWEQYIKKGDLNSLYFNAWATDFSEDPLVSFLGEMNEGLGKLIGTSEESRKAWSRAKHVGKQIAKRALPALIKIGTAGVIDAEKAIEDEFSKVTESLANDALEDYLKDKNAIKEFRETLTRLIKLSSGSGPVFIFVDELDRCRPTYAIKLLERIKHLFDIEGLIFVLALDKEQLKHSISAVYGKNIDTNGYLRRFIDFEYQLKWPENKSYIDFLFSSLSLNDFFDQRKKYRSFQYDQEHLANVFLLLAECHKLSLREIEQLLASINISLRTAKENEFVYPALLSFLVVTKNVHPDKYYRYISDSGEDSEIIEYLYSIVPEKKRLESFACALIEGFIISAKHSKYHQFEPESLTRHTSVLDSKLDSKNFSSNVIQYSEWVVNVATNSQKSGNSVNLKTLVDKIELLSRFTFSTAEGEQT